MDWWPHLRALLVAAHLFAISLMAFPAPSGTSNRASWNDPTVQAELKAWHHRVVGWGYTGGQQQFEDQIWSITQGWMDARSDVLKPLDPYFRYCGTWQSWRMFVAPHMFPARLHIDVEEGGVWRSVYVGRSDEHDWKRSIFDHDRVRAATFRYAWTKYATPYRSFSEWIAKQAAVDFPNADKVRIRFYKAKSPSPEEVLEDRIPEGSFVLPREMSLGRFR